MGQRCCLRVCVCVYPPIVARQRLGKNPPILARQWLGKIPLIVARQRLGKNVSIVARQRLGKNSLIVARQRLGKISLIVARQRLGRNVTAVTNTHLTIEELLDVSFSMWPLSFQGKQPISSSQNFLLHLLSVCLTRYGRNLI
jgi:UDP-3-O-[3-hydroxymyristoyl] glucosamine N-acyltransferase